MSSTGHMKYWTAGFQNDPDGVDSGAIHDSRPLLESARRERQRKNETMTEWPSSLTWSRYTQDTVLIGTHGSGRIARLSRFSVTSHKVPHLGVHTMSLTLAPMPRHAGWTAAAAVLEWRLVSTPTLTDEQHRQHEA